MKRVLSALALVGLVLAGVALAGTQGAAAARSPAGVSAVAALEHETLLAINGVRREQGLPPLRLDLRLAATARNHSRSMAEHGFFGHACWDGSAFWRRIRSAYPPVPGRGWAAGENVLWASPALTAQTAVEMWMRSPPHRKNLLAPDWREVGIGGVHASAAPGVYRGLDVTILTADFAVR